MYRLELVGKFPKRRQLSLNCVAWLESEIAAWANSRPIAHLRGTAWQQDASRRLSSSGGDGLSDHCS